MWNLQYFLGLNGILLAHIKAEEDDLCGFYSLKGYAGFGSFSWQSSETDLNLILGTKNQSSLSGWANQWAGFAGKNSPLLSCKTMIVIIKTVFSLLVMMLVWLKRSAVGLSWFSRGGFVVREPFRRFLAMSTSKKSIACFLFGVQKVYWDKIFLG